ncbi:PTS sugar transporter subunit IIA [Amphibacillus jilinensis]|uniref:PTS sugar transporter subunit IIA n=1 Tax=Amphibacillus jilinensis TaxID=1216008 RepID=UPI0002EADEC7|nr:PTS sugar transporter subunit IIA [Amphibacillus jilinensis]
MKHLQFDESFILKNLEAQSKEDAITQLATLLFDKGAVRASYIDAVLDREKRYATGLPTKGHAVAIPHTDIIHVKHKALALGVLKEPVEFGIMGEDSKSTPVSIIFMLAMDEEHSQLTLLQNLMGIFQDEAVLHFLMEEENMTIIKEKLLTALAVH